MMFVLGVLLKIVFENADKEITSGVGNLEKAMLNQFKRQHRTSQEDIVLVNNVSTSCNVHMMGVF